MYDNFLIQSSINGHLDCFYVLTIIHSASVNPGVHVSFSVMVFLRYMPNSGIVVSYGSLVPSFYLLLLFLI